MRKALRLFYFSLNILRGVKLPYSTKINGYSVLTKLTHLGRNCHFNGLKIRGGGKVTIGDNFHSGELCLFITDIHNYKGNAVPYDNTIITKDINIGNNVWIGTGVTILGGVNIADGAIIQAGSVVVSDIGYCEIAGGHPARVFAERDLNHYENCVKEKRFF
ncbi:acetyltransferase [Pseudoalteromonas phenolica]|nr:acetyltransferase [Pseudoalteromonas phenolica]